MSEQRRAEIETRIAQAVDLNSAFLANPSPSNAEVVAQVRLVTRIVQALLRERLGRFEGLD